MSSRRFSDNSDNQSERSLNSARQPRCSDSTCETSVAEEPDDDSVYSDGPSEFTQRTGSTIYQRPPNYRAPPPPHRRPGKSYGYIDCISDEYVAAPNPRAVPLLPLPVPPLSPPQLRSNKKNETPRAGNRHSTAAQRIVKRRCLVVLTMVSILLSLFTLLVVVLSFVWQAVPNWEHVTWHEGDYETCLPCSELDADRHMRPNSLLSQLEHRQEENGTKTCCARTSGQMSAMVLLIINVSRNIEPPPPPPPSKYHFSPVSAHVTFVNYTDKRNAGAKFQAKDAAAAYYLKLKIPTNNSGRFHLRNVSPRTKSLEIGYSGRYLVYASVHFRVDKANRPCKEQTRGLAISRYHPNRPTAQGTLARSVSKYHDDLCKKAHQTGYAGGVFDLEKDDQISVTVSDEKLVVFDNADSYLGLVMLASA